MCEVDSVSSRTDRSMRIEQNQDKVYCYVRNMRT